MDISLLDRAIEEKLVTLTDVTWEQFKGIEAQLIDNRSVRLSYLSGILEIMSPIGEEHEAVKSSLSLLLDAYIIETAESEGWVEKLIRGARESNPGNSKLLIFEQEFFSNKSEGNSQQNKEDLRKDENSPPTPDSRQAIAKQKPTQRWAFLVGVNSYIDSNFGQLKFCVNDVLALEKSLKQFGYEVRCLHEDRKWDDPLFPTRDNVEARLKEMCKAVQENDLLWVHFACHGTQVNREASKKEPVLIMRDTQYSLIEKRALPVAEVEQYMKETCPKASRMEV